MANATTTAILDTIRAKLPGVSAGQINLEIFNTVDELAREALRVSAPTDPTAEPDTWLSSALWTPNYQVILDGALYRLYAQAGKAWASAELATFHKDRYAVLLQLSRTEAASAPTSVYDRVIFNLRMRIPVARDVELKAPVFFVANKIRVDALGLAALGTVDATPSSWLPTDKWDACFQALLQGALAQLYTQVGKPWSAPELGAVSQTQFDQELQLLRSDALVAPLTIYQRIVNAVRAQAPEAREAPIKLALFAVADKIRAEALRLTPLVDNNTDPSQWLPADKWDDCYLACLYGTLAHLQIQVGQPWFSPETATANQSLFAVELNLLRSDEATSPASIYQRILNTIRVQLPSAREAVVKLAMFSIANKIRVDALGITPLTDASTDPSTWLPSDKWDDAYNTLLYGTLTRLQMQVGQPWSNEQAAAANQTLFVQELALLRIDEVGSPATVYQRILNTVRAQIPDIRETPVKLVLFGVVNKLRADAFHVDVLTDAATSPSSWLTSDQWNVSYRAALHGSLAALQLQVGASWYSPDAATINNTIFVEEFVLLRGDDAGAPATVYDRLIKNLRVQIPQLRDTVLRLEVYNTADKIRREALWLDPLTDSDTNPSTWLPATQWDNCYQALLTGTLFRLFSQAGKPWSNPELAKEQYALYQAELDLVRGEQSTKSPASNFTRLKDIIRVRLPGARDNIISIELYLLINEFLQETNVWVDEITVPIVSGQSEYTISSINGVINRLMALVDANDLAVPCRLTPPTLFNPDYSIKLATTPSAAATYRAYVAVALDPNTQPEDALPDWIITKYREGIEDGLLARMMMQAAKPYSNPKLAQFHGARYRRAVSLARTEALHAYKFRGQGWNYPRSFIGKRSARI